MKYLYINIIIYKINIIYIIIKFEEVIESYIQITKKKKKKKKKKII